MTQDKQKFTAAEQRQRREDRLVTIRLRMAIGRALDDQGITTAAAVGEALGMPADEATSLMTRRQWREGGLGSAPGGCGAAGADYLASGRKETTHAG